MKLRRDVLMISTTCAMVICVFIAVLVHLKRPCAPDGRSIPENSCIVSCGLERVGFKLMDMEQPNTMPTTAQSNALVSAFAVIEDAYASGQVDLMMQRISVIPDCVTNVASHVYVEIIGPCQRRFGREFLFCERLEDFANEEQLLSHLRLHMEMARMLGTLLVRRKECEGYLMLIDRRVLKRLVRYRDKFRNEKLTSLERCVERHIAEWIDQIESKNGFTRRYMWMQVSLQYSRVSERGWTCERLLESVRHEADGLIAAGYTPKWLSEFYVGEWEGVRPQWWSRSGGVNR